MTVKLLNPPAQIEDPLYHHVSVASGSRYVHLAGQVAWNEHGELVDPGDLAGQVVQVLRNVNEGLEAAGSTFADVVRITWYAADWQQDRRILYALGILVEAEVTAVVN